MNSVRVAVLVVFVGAVTNAGRAADTPKPLELKEHSRAITAVAWAADGKTVATAGDDRSVRVWNPTTGRLLTTLKHLAGEGRNPVFAFASNLKFVAVEQDGWISIRTVADGSERIRIDAAGALNYRFGPTFAAMAISPNGKWLAAAGNGVPLLRRYGLVIVWEISTGKIVHKFAKLETAAGAVAWSRDGKRFAAGTIGRGGRSPEAGEVWVWDFRMGKVLHRINVKPAVKPGELMSAGDVAFGPDGNRIAVPVTTGRATFSPVIFKETGTSVRMWDLGTGKSRTTLKKFEASVDRVVFSPDGKSIATLGGDKRDRSVSVWNVETGKQLATLRGPDRMTAAAFSPDGNMLAAACRDGSVRIWKLPVMK